MEQQIVPDCRLDEMNAYLGFRKKLRYEEGHCSTFVDFRRDQFSVKKLHHNTVLK
jgi:hypothetical protein